MSALDAMLPTTMISTLEGFRTWSHSPEFPDNLRAAFLDKELFIDMSNEDPETHVKVKGDVFFYLRLLCQQTDPGVLYTNGVLLTNDEANLACNADATFMTWESLDAEKVVIVPRENEEGRFLEIRGTPDLVLEVVSDSSVGKDTRRLRELYHRAGIPEYWLIDARGDEIDFTILLWRKRGYVTAPGRAGWQMSSVFGREFRLTRKRGRRNLWVYELENR